MQLGEIYDTVKWLPDLFISKTRMNSTHARTQLHRSLSKKKKQNLKA